MIYIMEVMREWNILRFGKRNITKIFILDFIAHDVRNKQNDGLRDMGKRGMLINTNMSQMKN